MKKYYLIILLITLLIISTGCNKKENTNKETKPVINNTTNNSEIPTTTTTEKPATSTTITRSTTTTKKNTTSNKTTTKTTTTKKTTTSKASTLTYSLDDFDTSNPKINCATKYVGKKNIPLKTIMLSCLSVVGKDLSVDSSYSEYIYVSTFDGEKNTIGFDEEGKKKAESITGNYTTTNKVTTNSNNEKYYDKNYFKVENGIVITSERKRFYLNDNNEIIKEENVPYESTILNPGDKVWDVITYKTELVGGGQSETNIQKIGTKVSIDSLIPGDFMYYDLPKFYIDVAIYIGKDKNGNKMAVFTDDDVFIDTIYPSNAKSITAYRVN